MPTPSTLIDFGRPSTAPTRAAIDTRSSPRTTVVRPVDAPRVRLRRDELIDLATQLSVMLDAGVTITAALDCVVEQTVRPQARQVLSDVAGRLEGGEPLSEACGRHPRSFPRVFVTLVRASEKSGSMPAMLDRASMYLKDEQEIVRRVKGAATYPAMLLGFAVLVTVSLLVFVLPRFTVLYEGKEHLLPVPTQILMTVSDALVYQWYFVLGGIGVGGWAIWAWLRTDAGRATWHAAQLNLPVVGPLLRDLHLTRALRAVGTLTRSGVPLVEAVETAQNLATNESYARLWADVGDEMRQGNGFGDLLASQPLVPPATVRMVASGESGGRLADVLLKVAAAGESRLKEKIAEVTRYIEPLMIVLIGSVIGGIVLALLLPVFTVGRTLH